MYKSFFKSMFWVICTASLIGCGESSSSPDLSDKISSSRDFDSSIASSSSQVLEPSSSSDEASSSSQVLEPSSSSDEASSSSQVLEPSSSSDEASSSSQVLEPSSSSDEASSSSQVLESSSSIKTLEVKSLYDPIAHTLTDLRDNHVYKTVTIGEQIWMAENLNYKYKANTKSYCYNDSTKYCNLYGRLYTEDVRNSLCPEKWHLPDSLEWEMLIKTADKKNGPLKADSSWVDETQYGHPESKGTNETGFSALGGGYRAVSSRYTSMGYVAAFWVAKAKWSIEIGQYNPDPPLYVGLSTMGTPPAYSVRCIKDN